MYSIYTKSRNKYRNKKVYLPDVGWFDSKAEKDRYLEMMWEEKAGNIKNLVRQVKYNLIMDDKNIVDLGTYTSDIEYDMPDGTHVVEDVKSPATAKLDIFKMKRNIMYACHDIIVRIVMRDKQYGGWKIIKQI